MKWTIGVGAALALALAAPGARAAETLTVSSPVFKDGGAIPTDYTCEGRSVSPPIEWSNVPDGTKSIAVIVDDADAPGGTYQHLVAFNLAPSARTLPSASAKTPLPTGMTARNSGGTTGFAPICPPSGTHHYRFEVLALDTTLPKTSGARAGGVVDAMKGHVLARGELTGLYGKGGAEER